MEFLSSINEGQTARPKPGYLFASAFFRMGRYMEVRGLTVKRVLLKVWKPGVHLTGIVLLTTVCITVVLNGMQIDALMARVNVNRYLKDYEQHPTSAQIDTAYLGRLSADAVPYLAKLLHTSLKNDAIQAMARIQKRLELYSYGTKYHTLDEETPQTWAEARRAAALFGFGDGPAETAPAAAE